MRFKIKLQEEEIIDDLTLASAIINFCDLNREILNPVKVANAILVEMVGDTE
jgi:hypothetical protein